MGPTGPLSWGMKSPTNAIGPHAQRPRRIAFHSSSAGMNCTAFLGLHLPQSHRGLASSHGPLSVPLCGLVIVNLSHGLHHPQNYDLCSDHPFGARSLPTEASGNCSSAPSQARCGLLRSRYPTPHWGPILKPREALYVSRSVSSLGLQLALVTDLPLGFPSLASDPGRSLSPQGGGRGGGGDGGRGGELGGRGVVVRRQGSCPRDCWEL